MGPSMLQRRDYLRCLTIFNDAVRETHPDLVMDDAELFRLLNKGTFGPPSALTVNALLSALVRRALARLTEPHASLPDGPAVAPSLAETQTWQSRYMVRIFRLGQAGWLPGEHLLGPDISGNLLTARRTRETVHFTTGELFNVFNRLKLRWTLRDADGRCVRRLSDTEAEAWRSDRRRTNRRLRLSLYPSPGDRKKILHFVETYGPEFMPYPPQVSHHPRPSGSTGSMPSPMALGNSWQGRILADS
jgi:hypothetical protein